MRIDFGATKNRFDDSCLSGAKLARRIGVNRALFGQVVSGKYPAMSGDKAQLVLAELRRREILVEIPDG